LSYTGETDLSNQQEEEADDDDGSAGLEVGCPWLQEVGGYRT